MAEYALSNPRASLATFLEDVDSEDQEGIRSQADGTPLDREECEAALKVHVFARLLSGRLLC